MTYYELLKLAEVGITQKIRRTEEQAESTTEERSLQTLRERRRKYKKQQEEIWDMQIKEERGRKEEDD